MSTAVERPAVPGKPDVGWLRTQYRRVLDSQIGASPVRGPYAPGMRTLIFGGILALTGVGALPGLVLIGYGVKRYLDGGRKKQEILASVATHEPVMAFIHMANTALMAPGRGDAPALVVFSFEEHLTMDYFVELCERITLLDPDEDQDEAVRTTAAFFEDMSYVENARFRIPEKLTGGPEVYAAHLWITRRYLPGHQLQWPMVPCMAEPGETGHLGLLPGWFALGQPSPPPGWQQFHLDLDELVEAVRNA